MISVANFHTQLNLWNAFGDQHIHKSHSQCLHLVQIFVYVISLFVGFI